jgi:DNA-binding IclR family transcriptional regulator
VNDLAIRWEKMSLPMSSKPRTAKSEDASKAPGNSRAPAVARVATVLRLLAGEQSGLGVNEIARRVGLIPSTCFHVLRALVEEGFVAFDPEKKTYRTGVGLLTLVRDAMASADYPKAVKPALEALSADFRVTALAVELDVSERMVVVAFSRSESFVSLHVPVGSRFPGFISATGRCVAAASKLSREELKARFDILRWEQAPKFEDWYADVERARREGVAVDRGNYIKGLTIMSLLLPAGPDRVTRGMALIGFDHHMTEKFLRQLKDAAIDAVRSVAAQLN